MSEEYGNDFVTLIDEDGNEVGFEHIDTVEYEGVTYLAFIPAELCVEEDAEVVIMQVVTDENGEELLEGRRGRRHCRRSVQHRHGARRGRGRGNPRPAQTVRGSIAINRLLPVNRSCPVRQRPFFNPHF